MIIGITGSFGSGKSTVANMFRKYGFKVINVDKLYHGIYKKNLILKFKIKKEFGTLDRNKIKKIVFNDFKKLKRLNGITHPLIIKAIKKEIKRIRKQQLKQLNLKSLKIKKTIIKKILNNKKLKNNEIKNIGNVKIVIDVPLLFEAKIEKLFDKIIVVKCNKNTQINRILKKKKYSKKEIQQIIKSQMPLKEKIKKADFVVDNENLRSVKTDVRNVIEKL
jgi:dephospho-CoA kinase|tara:strand:- start:185 stop:844 length:660 start_codon:yes stop_codon:yes gene_type:complete